MKHLTELQWFNQLPASECDIARQAFFLKNKPSEYFDSLLEALKSIDMEYAPNHADVSENKAFPTIADYFNSVIDGLGDAIFKTVTNAADFVHDQEEDESSDDFEGTFGDIPDVGLPQEVTDESKPSLVTQIGKFVKIQNSAIIHPGSIKSVVAHGNYITIDTYDGAHHSVKCGEENRDQIMTELTMFLPND